MQSLGIDPGRTKEVGKSNADGSGDSMIDDGDNDDNYDDADDADDDDDDDDDDYGGEGVD